MGFPPHHRFPHKEPEKPRVAPPVAGASLFIPLILAEIMVAPSGWRAKPILDFLGSRAPARQPFPSTFQVL
jgi:hypothetical protein